MSATVIAALIPILQSKCPKLDLELMTLDESIQYLGLDSLDFLELVYQIETQFGIELPIQDLEKARTLRHLVDAISRQCENKQDTDPCK
jgi:acyl carrier protein